MKIHPTKKDTKILCTIGPSSWDINTLKKMYLNGMNALRINTAHGNFSEYKKIVNRIRKIADIPIVLDIKGPELRIRTSKAIKLKKGQSLEIGTKKSDSVHLNFDIIKNLNKGDKVLIDDGKYEFTLTQKKNDKIIIKAKKDSEIKPNKNLNIPNKSLELPQLSDNDIKAIKFAKTNKISYIALSFCRNKDDVINLKNKLKKTGIKIISKIENHEGIENISEIIDESAAIMVARGDLGVEMAPEEVPLLQKKIIKECNEKGKAVIVATQMLESMVNNSTPTRAETSDIANAILDGADCLMLSEETAIGTYPVESVKYMTKVARKIEPNITIDIENCESKNISESISCSIYSLASSLKIDKIICLTYSGYTASKIARFRLNIPVYAITSSALVKKQMMIYQSIEPILYKSNFWSHPILKTAKYLYKKKLVNKNDILLFTAGLHSKSGKKTNTIQIHKLSELFEFF